jgi:hypothetical protein
MKFIDRMREGIATQEDFQEAIDAWHKSTSKDSVEDFLGISQEDYFLFIKDASYLERMQEKKR